MTDKQFIDRRDEAIIRLLFGMNPGLAASPGFEFRSEMLRDAVALGEARAILTVLERRGVAVPDQVRDQVIECTDTSQLDIWLHRAITATTVDDVIHN